MQKNRRKKCNSMPPAALQVGPTPGPCDPGRPSTTVEFLKFLLRLSKPCCKLSIFTAISSISFPGLIKPAPPFQEPQSGQRSGIKVIKAMDGDIEGNNSRWNPLGSIKNCLWKLLRRQGRINCIAAALKVPKLHVPLRPSAVSPQALPYPEAWNKLLKNIRHICSNRARGQVDSIVRRAVTAIDT